jgi:hypothetical protein
LGRQLGQIWPAPRALVSRAGFGSGTGFFQETSPLLFLFFNFYFIQFAVEIQFELEFEFSFNYCNFV